MTTDVAIEQKPDTGSMMTLVPLFTLGRREARRMLLSPVYGLVMLVIVASMGLGSAVRGLRLPSATTAYEFLLFVSLLYAGLLTYMAAHLVATSSRRTHADRQLAASALSTRTRGGALCLGVVLGPGLVAALAVAVMAWLGADLATPVDGAPLSIAELVQIVLMVVGGGIFGVMVATWLRFPGSMLIGLVSLVFATLFLGDPDGGGVDQAVPWFAPYSTAPSWLDASWAAMGSQSWHAAYLAGLCALGVCAVMLRRREGRGRWLAISSLVVLATGVVGWAQL